MGTRNLTMVQVDGVLKVAQYGQWDGYPGGNGTVVLDFLRGLSREGEAQFADKVRACHWVTPLERERLCEESFGMHPSMTRDTGAGILAVIMASDGVPLFDQTGFAKDSLFCEWAYCVNLDDRTLEVYTGSNTSPVPEGQRFSDMEPNAAGVYNGTERYYPITLLKTYSFDELPTHHRLVTECDPPEPDAA